MKTLLLLLYFVYDCNLRYRFLATTCTVACAYDTWVASSAAFITPPALCISFLTRCSYVNTSGKSWNFCELLDFGRTVWLKNLATHCWYVVVCFLLRDFPWCQLHFCLITRCFFSRRSLLLFALFPNGQPGIEVVKLLLRVKQLYKLRGPSVVE